MTLTIDAGGTPIKKRRRSPSSPPAQQKTVTFTGFDVPPAAFGNPAKVKVVVGPGRGRGQHLEQLGDVHRLLHAELRAPGRCLSASVAGWIAVGAAVAAAAALLVVARPLPHAPPRPAGAARAPRRRQVRSRRLRRLAAEPARRAPPRRRRGRRLARQGRPPRRRDGLEDRDRPLRRIRELGRAPVGLGRAARLRPHRASS